MKPPRPCLGLLHPLAALVMVTAASVSAAQAQIGHAPARAELERNIQKRVKQDYPGMDREIVFRSVLKAIASIDRANFVPNDQRANANRDIPIPIGLDQTI